MSESVRTLQLDTGREFRGGQRQVAMLVAGLAERGHPVDVVAPPGAPLARELAGLARVEVHEVPLRGELSLGAVRRLAALLATRRHSVIHVHTAHGITLAHLARRLAGRRPLVAHRHVAFAQRRNLLARRKRRWPERWIAVSQAVAERLEADHVPSDRIRVIPAALDPDSLAVRRSRAAVREDLGLAESLTLVTFVGALTENKNPGVLLEAASRLRREGRELHLLLVGDGPLGPRLSARARSGELSGRVVLAGEVPSAADLLAASDLAVFPSRSEGSHSALKEAVALGVPVLASAIPAHRELGLPRSSLFEPDDVGKLAARLADALDNLPARRTEASKLTAIAERFSPAAMVDATVEVYRELAASGSA